MKVLVAIKRVVDSNVRIRVRPDKLGVDLANVKMSMNPFCEIAVEEALRLKEQGHATEVVAVAIGPQSAQETLRTALAMGADRAVLVQTGAAASATPQQQQQQQPQPLGVARLLAAVTAREKPGLVLLGKQSVDSDANQTGQMLAALLKWPQATFASKVEIEKASPKARVTREVDGGLETVEVALPAVVTVDLRLNTPRYATLPNIMRAKKKPIASTSPQQLGVALTQQLATLKVEEPAKRQGGVIVSSVAELVDKLHREAKVL